MSITKGKKKLYNMHKKCGCTLYMAKYDKYKFNFLLSLSAKHLCPEKIHSTKVTQTQNTQDEYRDLHHHTVMAYCRTSE